MKHTRLLLIALLVGLFAMACKSKHEITTEQQIVMSRDTILATTHDTLIRYSFQRDTIFSRDSIYMEVRGDTVIREVYKYRYRDRIVTDTIYRSAADTAQEKIVDVVYKTRSEKEIVEVERKLSVWQKVLIVTGSLCWGFFALFVAYAVVRYRRSTKL